MLQWSRQRKGRTLPSVGWKEELQQTVALTLSPQTICWVSPWLLSSLVQIDKRFNIQSSHLNVISDLESRPHPPYWGGGSSASTGGRNQTIQQRLSEEWLTAAPAETDSSYKPKEDSSDLEEHKSSEIKSPERELCQQQEENPAWDLVCSFGVFHLGCQWKDWTGKPHKYSTVHFYKLWWNIYLVSKQLVFLSIRQSK